MTAALLGFALFALVVTVVPGPDLLLVLRNCLRGGRRAGAATALGAAAGSLVWAVAAAAGLAAALQRWDAAFLAVRLAGAAYLTALGVQALWSLRAGPAAGGGAPASPGPAEREETSVPHALRQGVVSCLLNPKVGIFFVAVAPQFLPEGHAVLTTTLLFGLVDAVVAACWLLLVAFCADRLLAALRRPRVARVLEGTAGGALVTLGALTAVEAARA
ncbi:LysE family translocator [Streptomyces liangshanensis]|uniref:LysE family translocator n=1 Tax=Streptomyces liangshanensis TaxID=2717324 RepID=A0A6G9GTU4_9ACTN|nr:LysE family translocator [Streptomyces liangshanensis]QIQ01479.1 LysE family translocator [Streptomyces liangshanensis]